MFDSEIELLELLVCSGASYSIAKMLLYLAKTNPQVAERQFKELGIEDLYIDVRRFYDGTRTM